MPPVRLSLRQGLAGLADTDLLTIRFALHQVSVSNLLIDVTIRIILSGTT